MDARLYLDNAATSFPKPQRVHDAMLRYAMEVGGTAGRGNYFEAREGARVINECRRRLCQFINGESWKHVVFALNTSDALNLAIKGIVLGAWMRGSHGPRGMSPIHVVATQMEHNSVLRPLAALTEVINAVTPGTFSWTCVEADQDGLVTAQSLAAAIRPETVLVAALHASNVTGTIQPVAEYGRVCRAARVNAPKPGGGGVPLLVDAAQTLGHEPVDVQAMGIDLLAFPGHKGLLGPLGTGGLYLRPGMEAIIQPVREGGTGSQSEQDTQPTSLPDKYEPGSQNAIGLAGLGEALAYLLERGDSIYEHDRTLRRAMLDGLADLDALGTAPGRLGLRLLGPHDPMRRVGVFSLTHDTLSPAELAALLEQEHGILTRAGLSCAPRVHQRLGTTADGGALRMSVGPFVSESDVRRACRALGEVCESTPRRSPVVETANKQAIASSGS